ncbi:hypothetical protein BCV72DRAFT_307081 [Rhizopus microsporus var. microsporus]|nr:hypothetical protein BCV72DRAFT_307081 [Rhizopus microsporus var. microsporus]
MLDTCKVNVSSTLVKTVIDGIKRKFAIKKDSTRRSVADDARLDAIQELEAKTLPYISLRAWVGSWGANILLDHYWSSFRRRNKKQATSDNDVAEIVQDSLNRSRLVISEAMSTSIVDEKFTFDFNASFDLTVDDPQK